MLGFNRRLVILSRECAQNFLVSDSLELRGWGERFQSSLFNNVDARFKFGTTLYFNGHYILRTQFLFPNTNLSVTFAGVEHFD